jgi:hypothetical protein
MIREVKTLILSFAGLLVCLGPLTLRSSGETPAGWIPARWDGGPLEMVRRAGDKALTGNQALRETIARWYDPSTLALLEGTPINCLLVTFSAGAAPEVEKQQLSQVKEYASEARKRGIAILGIVYPGADPQTVASASDQAQLDGLVLDGVFQAQAGFTRLLEEALRAKHNSAVVISIARDAAAARRAKVPILAVEGVRPHARDLADMGINAGASAQPWIDSNIWLVRSFRLEPGWRPVWIDQAPNSSLQGDYARSVADAAVAGGRWIVALDDDLKVRLLGKDADALATWRGIGDYLRFAEQHAEWRNFEPYGNVAIILDTKSEDSDYSNEYLNLVARRQVPYRLIERPQLSPDSLGGFQAVLAPDLVVLSDAERKMLRDFVEGGGVLVSGPSWGDAPENNDFAEVTIGKGRVVVYREKPPDPEMVARDLLDLLDPDVIGLTAFNVPSVITYVSMDGSGKRALIQLLNYATTPFDSKITIRLNGTFKTARMYTPESAPDDLGVRVMPNGRTEISIPRLAVWGAVLLE